MSKPTKEHLARLLEDEQSLDDLLRSVGPELGEDAEITPPTPAEVAAFRQRFPDVARRLRQLDMDDEQPIDRHDDPARPERSQEVPRSHDNGALQTAIGDEASQEVRLFVCNRDSGTGSDPELWGFFMNLLRLDIWGATLLGPKVANEMVIGYLILAIVLVCEVGAWFLLWSGIFSSVDVTAEIRYAAALILGTLTGAGFFAIDKTFITMDWSTPGPAKWGAFFARLVLIAISAFVTAQPVEQMVFRDMIEERLKQETLREEAVVYCRRLEERQEKAERAKASAPNINHDPIVAEQLKKANQDIADAREELESAEDAIRKGKTDLLQLQSNYSSTKARYNAAKRANLAEADALNLQVQTWRQKITQMDTILNERQQAAQAAQARISAAQEAWKNATEARREEGEQARKEKYKNLKGMEADAEIPRMFVDQVRRAQYGDYLLAPSVSVSPETETSASPDQQLVKWKKAGFIARNLLLEDIRRGDPPQWPGISDDERKKVEDLFGVKDPPAPKGIFWSWLFVMIVAASVPLLTVFFKFLSSNELKLYYSLEAQAREGNFEALRLQHARDSMR